MQDDNVSRQRTTILLVEDDDAVRKVAERALRRSGFDVLSAEGGDTALQLTREHPGSIELLLTDIMMPGMNGVEVANQVANLRPGIRVLFMSGYADQELVRRGLLDPETHFLQKPFAPQDLCGRVEEILADGAGGRRG